jgi:hypothetical protein
MSLLLATNCILVSSFFCWCTDHKNMQRMNNIKYRAFHNAVCDYKHLQQENQRTYLNGIFHSHRKTEKAFFWQLEEMFDVCTRGDTAHIDMISKLLLHMRQHVDACVVINVCNHNEHYETSCIIPMYEHSDVLIRFAEVFTLSNLHVLFVLKWWEVRLPTGYVFYLKIQKLMRYLTAVRIHENVQFPISHSEIFGVKN